MSPQNAPRSLQVSLRDIRGVSDSMRRNMKNIVIIGAGFCGAVTAAQLLRTPSPVPLQVVLINRSGLMARGIAYGTRTDSHVLNVPAGRMSAYPEQEDHFLRFAQRHDARVTSASFVPRRMFGDYLEWLLSDAARNAASGNSLRAIVGDVARIDAAAESVTASVVLDSGIVIEADRVVLALGNYAPADPGLEQGGDSFYSHPRYVRDPWRPDALWVAKPDQPVLLIGTGLTMLDVLMSLRARGVTAPIHALSRRGLLPLPHRELELAPHYSAKLAQRLANTPGLRNWLREIRQEVASVARHGVDWRDVIGGLRAATPQLWQSLPAADKQRFLRHLRSYWDVHRHRCAPELGDALKHEQASGLLQLHKGRLLGFTEHIDGADVHWRPRGAEASEQLTVGTVINCTGPEGDTRRMREPLIAGLRDAGLLTPDQFGLGLRVSADYRLLDALGRPSSKLHYIGPFLRAEHWEATAVPELRRHCAQLAVALRESLSAEPTRAAA